MRLGPLNQFVYRQGGLISTVVWIGIDMGDFKSRLGEGTEDGQVRDRYDRGHSRSCDRLGQPGTENDNVKNVIHYKVVWMTRAGWIVGPPGPALKR